MVFSRECEYALMGMAALAADPGAQPVMLSEIAARGGLPLSFLSKIFQKLLKHGLVQSHRGARRGYTLVRPASAITLRQALEAIEGPDLFDRCAFWHDTCGRDGNLCSLHELWKESRIQLQQEVETLSLADLARQQDSKITRRRHPTVPDTEVNRWRSGRPRERSS